MTWKVTNNCDEGWREGEQFQKEKSENSQGRDPGTLERNSHGKDPTTPKDRSYQAERWRVQKKWKKEKRRKKKKKKEKAKHRENCGRSAKSLS